MTCAYRLTGGPCGAPIVPDRSSYSGYSHATPADWLHWASPKPYGPQDSNSSFVLCGVCGKDGPGNDKHVLYPSAGGHAFIAQTTP